MQNMLTFCYALVLCFLFFIIFYRDVLRDCAGFRHTCRDIFGRTDACDLEEADRTYLMH